MKIDWGVASSAFDKLNSLILDKDLSIKSEAQLRFSIIDRILREVLGWTDGQIFVEERMETSMRGYVDYVLKSGDITIVIEAKKIGEAFINPTKAKSTKLNSVLLKGTSALTAINQAVEYSKSKAAQVTVVTNGKCWCYFLTEDVLSNIDAKIGLIFPFDDDSEKLYNLFAENEISTNGLSKFKLIEAPVLRNKLLSTLRDSELRIDRNNISDHISIALDGALRSDSILNNATFLEHCFVYTTARSKFDSALQIHLVDSKPDTVLPARRINKNRSSELLNTITVSKSAIAPPVILLLAEVGVGKSTYLRHFQLVQGRDSLEKEKVHWVYIDFEKMGMSGNVRNFLYKSLLDYLLNQEKLLNTNYDEVIFPAYKSTIESLSKGPLSLIMKDELSYNNIVTEYIKKDLDAVEPYVERLFKYLSEAQHCIIVLDNIDLFENSELEKSVLSEGIAFAKNVSCQVIVSIRDTTYVKHKNDSVFNAYELKKIWLDPAPIREVLSKRLSFAGRILKGKKVKIPFNNSMKLEIEDLSVFFEISQRSLLSGVSGDFIESFSGQNIRKGLGLVNNFLNSGHIQADRALIAYCHNGDKNYVFPFHEVFKGSILGYWKYYKENRSAECINLFDSGFGQKNLQLLRLLILSYLNISAENESTAKVSVDSCITIFSKTGANSSQIIKTIQDLVDYQLVRENNATVVNQNSCVYITRTGGYYFSILGKRINYVEACMLDTSIDEFSAWGELRDLTSEIESNIISIHDRMMLRESRLQIFAKYLKYLEDINFELIEVGFMEKYIDKMKMELKNEFDIAFEKIHRQGGRNKFADSN